MSEDDLFIDFKIAFKNEWKEIKNKWENSIKADDSQLWSIIPDPNYQGFIQLMNKKTHMIINYENSNPKIPNIDDVRQLPPFKL